MAALSLALVRASRAASTSSPSLPAATSDATSSSILEIVSSTRSLSGGNILLVSSIAFFYAPLDVCHHYVPRTPCTLIPSMPEANAYLLFNAKFQVTFQLFFLLVLSRATRRHHLVKSLLLLCKLFMIGSLLA